MAKIEPTSKASASAKSKALGKQERLGAEFAHGLTYRALEQRIAFDGAMVATADAVAPEAPEPPVSDAPGAVDAAKPLSFASAHELAQAIAPAGQSSGADLDRSVPNVVVFIDGAVDDVGVIAAAIPDGAEIHVLEQSGDGLSQISAVLLDRRNIDAIHIVSHGAEGRLVLGGGSVNADTLAGIHADELAVIRSALSDDADILLYGCDVAAGDIGASFVSALAAGTGADVAASTDDTGHADRGGDWDLETQSGAVETRVLSAPEWDHTLAPLVISVTLQPTVTGATGVNVSTLLPEGGAGMSAVWLNAGTIGGTSIDVKATLVSLSNGTASFNTFGDDLSFWINNSNSTAVVTWEIFASGTNQTVYAVGSPNLQIADVDGSGGLPNSREIIRPQLSGLTSYTLESPTNLIAATSAAGVNVSGTQNQTQNPPTPISMVGFTWQDVSSWTVEYQLTSVSLNANFRHDGDGDFVFSAPITTYLLSLDLDQNNSTASGYDFQTTYTENAAGVSVVDADNLIAQHSVLGTSLGEAKITLTNAQAGDRLLVAGSADASGTISGVNYTITNSGGQIAIDFSGVASPADYQSILGQITFDNTTEAPPSVDRTIEVNVTNSTFGTASNTANSTVHVVTVNDAPSSTDDDVTTAEDTPKVLALTDFGTYADPEGAAIASVLITALETDGSLEYFNGLVWAPVALNQSVTAADITAGKLRFVPDANEAGSPYATIGFQVSDGSLLSAAANTLTIHVTPANDAPAGAASTITTFEDVPYVFAAADFGFADPNDTPANSLLDVKIGSLPLNGTLSYNGTAITSAQVATGFFVSAAEIAAGKLEFTPAANASGSPHASFTFQVRDNGGTAGGGIDLDPTPNTITMFVPPVNDAPLGADKTITINEDATYTVTVADFGFSDPNDTPSNAFKAVIINTVPATDTLRLDGIAVSAGQTVTIADIIDGKLQYVSPANANGAALANFTFQVQDDGGTSVTADEFVETFGAGTGRTSFADAGLSGTTTYNYAGTGLIFDGAYALVSAIDAGQGIWWANPAAVLSPTTQDFTFGDHTGDADGRFLLVNASIAPGEFYRQDIVIGDTDVYQVSVSLASANNITIKPNVTIKIVDGAGATVATTTTGNIPDYTTSAAAWQTYALPAYLPPGNYEFVLVNNAPGGNGNDIFIDDIKFSRVIASAGADTDPVANTITFNVTPINDPPVAIDDNATASEDGSQVSGDVTPSAAGQDSDLDGDTLTVTQVNGAAYTPDVAMTLPSGAQLTMNAGGTYSYDPSGAFESLGAGQTAIDSFTYQISDGNGGFDTATVVVTVSGVNDAPIAVADTNSGTEQQSVAGNLIAGTISSGSGTGGADTDVEAQTLTVTGLSQGSVGNPIVLTHGTLTIQSNGNYTFVPNATANALGQGQVITEQVTYTVSDGNGGTAQATLTLSITGENDAPMSALAIPQATATDGGNVLVPTFGAFNDPDGEALTYALASGAPAWLSIDPATGVVSGTPPAGASQGGPLSNGSYSFGVTATDPHGAAVTVNATVVIANLPPVAQDDAASLGEDATSVSGNVVTDPATGDADAAPDSDPLSVIAAAQDGTPIVIGMPFTTAGGGVLTLDAGGGYTFAPGTAYNGLDAGETATETIQYTVSDGNGGTAQALLVITMTGSNDAPAVIDPANPGTPDNPVPAADPLNVIADVAASDGATPVAINAAAVFADPDGEALTFAASGLPAGLAIDPASGLITGTLAAGASQGGNDPVAAPGVYLVTVTATDPDGATTATTLTYTVANLPPVAQDDAASLGEDAASVSGNVVTDPATGDTDAAPDSDPLTVIAAAQGGNPIVIGMPFTTAGGGVLTLDAGGGYTFAPGTAYNGLDAGEVATETIQYTVSDGNGGTAQALLVITMTGSNDAPAVIDPSNPGTPDNPVPAADPLNVIADVAASDGATPVAINAAAVFSDPDGEALTFAASGLPAGLAIDPATGLITGTLDPAASQGGNHPVTAPGLYLVIVTATDPDGATTATTLTYTIANLPPVAHDDAASLGEDATSVSGNVVTDPATGDADAAPDSDPLTVIAAAQGGNPIVIGMPFTTAGGGVLTLDAGGGYTFAPGTAYNGLDAAETATETIQYTVSDDNGGTATALLVITMTGSNDAPAVIDPSTPGTPDNPVPAADPLNVIPDVAASDGATSVAIDAAAVFADPDGEALTFAASGLPAGLDIDPATGLITGTLDPAASQGGDDPVTAPGVYLVIVTATDPDGATTATTLTYTIANLPPVAQDDAAPPLESGQSVTINVIANDRDGSGDGDALRVIAAVAQHGTVVIEPDGSITYTPSAGYDGADVVIYTVSDGNGGTATARVPVSVLAVPVPLIDAPKQDVPETRPHRQQETHVPGMVLTTVSSLGHDRAVAVGGIVLDAVDQANDNSGINVDGIILPTVREIGRPFGTPFERTGSRISSDFDANGLQSFSLTLSRPEFGNAVRIETFVRGQQLIMKLGWDEGLSGSSVLEWKVQRADGRPLPDWLGFAGRDVLMGERSAQEEVMDLRIIGIREDGSTVSNEIRINAVTGEIQPLKIGRSGAAEPKMFWEQLRAERILTEGETQALGRMLGSRR